MLTDQNLYHQGIGETTAQYLQDMSFEFEKRAERLKDALRFKVSEAMVCARLSLICEVVKW